jgi:3',5'-nucleoside bisphosphate phosphatase
VIDLHIHSTASDGSLSPEQILVLARDTGVRAISLTDHDTVDGIREILASLPAVPVDFITGVEISCAPPSGFETVGSVHLLGYGFSLYDRHLNQMLSTAKTAREQRNPKIIHKLQQLGVNITLAELASHAGTGQIGRPHIAQMMVEKGFVSSFRQAFDDYLGNGRPAYVDKFKVPCQTAIQTLLDAGGIPVLAHPGLLTFNRSKDLALFVDTLMGYGLQGIEVFYTDHDAQKTAYFSTLARKKKILATGGSDFHGSFNEGVALGRGKDNLQVPYACFKALTDRVNAMRCLHERLDILEASLGHPFVDRSLLQTALCHRSFLNENQTLCDTDNERLEFLGDAVLGLCVGHILMQKSPSKKEGELSRLRSALVSEPSLADMARSIDLGRFIRLGKGEAGSGGADKNSILSDTFEAVVAAVFLDAGFDITCDLVQRLFQEAVDTVLACDHSVDYKSSIQEYAQEVFARAPVYTVIRETGPDHDKTFEICLELAHIRTRGFGKSKKVAEQDAAGKALNLLKIH